METITQEDVRDCGLVTIQYLFDYYYKHKLNLAKLKHEASYGKEGISILEMQRLAIKSGLELHAFRGQFSELEKFVIQDPIIALVNKNGMNHFVVINKIKKKYFYYFDPFEGEVKEKKDNFQLIYKNVILTSKQRPLNLDKTIYQKESPKIFANFRFSKMNLAIFLLTLIINLLTFALAFYLKIVFDKVVPNRDQNLALYISSIFFLATVLKLLLNYLRDMLISRIEYLIHKKMSQRFYLKIIASKNQEFTKLKYEDYFRRDALMMQICNFKAKFLFALFSEVISFSFATALLLWLNYQLFLITILAALVLLLISLIYQNIAAKNYKKMISLTLKLNVANYDLIMSKKEANSPSLVHHLLQKRNASFDENATQEWSFYRQSSIKNFIASFVSASAPILLVLIGTLAVFNNQLSLGVLLLFLMTFNFFIHPLISFGEILIKKPLYQKNIELLNYVFEMANTKYNPQGIKLKSIHELEISHYSFSYEKSKTLLQIENFYTQNHLHIKGKNGVGKSSLVSTLYGSYEYSGEIKYNGINFNLLDKEDFFNKAIYLYPGAYFFSGQVLDYLCKGDGKLIKKLQENIILYGLHRLLSEAQISLEQELYNNGSSLSSGQRQIIYLLRLFTQPFNLIILDEAFENIDQRNRKFLMKAIKDFQKEAFFIEISHSQYFLQEGKELDLEKTL